MRIAGLLASLILACTLSAGLSAQAAKPELRTVDFKTLDKNHDGKLSRAEARADPGLSMDFDALDENHDGNLSMEEFQRWPRAGKTNTPDPGTAPGGSSGAQHLPRH
jgi:Ca2+-binding EF-hand superfamily protein